MSDYKITVLILVLIQVVQCVINTNLMLRVGRLELDQARERKP